MKIVSFVRPDGTASFGTANDRGIRDVQARARGPWKNAPELAADLQSCSNSHLVGDADFAFSDVSLLPPSPAPQKIICVGLNYRAHVQETKREMPTFPTFFPRYPDSIVGHGAALVRPKVSEQFDFEGELALVIGRGGRHIKEADGLDHVAGFMAFNDGSIRDYQYKTTQFLPGKCFWKTGSAGPFMVTPDEAGPIDQMHLETRLNGEVVQSSPVGDLVFSVGRIIAELSAILPLHTGDVIATGTPSGVGVYRSPPLFMKGGDTVEVSISHVGVLRNTIVDDEE